MELQLTDFIIRPETSLRAAMERMTRNRRGVLFVCDQADHLVGVLSDGDVRRAIVDETLTIAPVSTVMNPDPVVERSRTEAIEALARTELVAVPVVGNEGRIQEVLLVDEQGDPAAVTWESSDAATPSPSALGGVAIIPARGGSKRLPRKNLATAAGTSLLGWAIRAAKETHNIDRIIVSTDDEEIAEAGRAFGAEVPWLRPENLARDDTRTVDVLVHALERLEHAHVLPTFGVLLEPTSPLRTPKHIDRAVSALANSEADSVMSVSLVPHWLNPEELITIESGVCTPISESRTLDTRLPRKEQSAVYVQNGLVYAFRSRSVLEFKSLYGNVCLPMVCDWDEFVDVDDPEDLRVADMKLRLIHEHKVD
jgi:CMP-N,N'-diacetyllegionaminic acid synthase